MIPLRDTIPTRTVPFVTRLLVAANVAAFVLELLQGERAHVGGFVVGVAWALFCRPLRRPAATYRIS